LVIPHLVGYVREQTGGFTGPTMLIAGILLIAAVLVSFIRRLLSARRVPHVATP
jgi:LPXTG-motif cell wall-anchored protein